MSHPFGRSRNPRSKTLTAQDFADDSKLGGVLDAVVSNSDNYKKATAKILEAQDRLQTLCDDDAWIQYLHLEAAVNTRVDLMLATVAKFCFNEGRRHQRHLRGRK